MSRKRYTDDTEYYDDLSVDGYTPEYIETDDDHYRPVTDDRQYDAPYRDEHTPYRPEPLRKAPRQTVAPGPQRVQPAQAAQPAQRQPKPAQPAQPAQKPASTAKSEPKRTRETAQKPVAVRNSRKPFALLSFITDERTHIFTGIALILLSVFVMIALFSHFSHGVADQSVVLNNTISQISEQSQKVGNAAGPFGAWLSHYLLCDTLGIGAAVLIVYLWLIGLSLIKVRHCSFWGTTFRCLLLAISISIVLGLLTYNSESTVYWGGNHGHYINKFLINNTTFVGAALVSILLVAAVCCVYLNQLRIYWRSCSEALRRRRDEAAEQRRLRMQQVVDDDVDEPEADEPDVYEPAATETPTAKGSVINSRDNNLRGTNSSVNNTLVVTDDNTPADTRGTTATKTVNPAIELKQTSSTAAAASDAETEINIDPDQSETVIDLGGGEIQVGDKLTIKANEIEVADAGTQGTDDDDKPFNPRSELSRYVMPDIELLEERPSGPSIDIEEIQENKAMIEKTLLDYKIPISHIEATVGPTVTLYEIVPAEGVRISQIKRLEDDIALSLKALGIRIIAPIPGKGTVGIEVPNNDPQTVSMRSVISSRKYQECKMALPMAMGATISNDIFIADLTKMPHLLVAGATGMGKSVGLNAIIASLLYKKHPTELKLVLVDPKMVEFSLYSKLERHYLAKLPDAEDAIITDMSKVVETLNSLCIEMDNRYELLRDANVRSLEEYNQKYAQRRLNPDKGHKFLPYIVVIVDEFADLIMTQGKEVETPIARIAQKARAVGIHMILATQRPSTNVITGLIKANFPGRIAFRVIQMVDSRTILDCPGANQLIGRGDMLFSHNGSMERVQCAFISTEEVVALTQHIDDQIGFEHAYYLPEFIPEEVEGGVIAGASTERDTLFDEAARFVVSRQMGSTSSLQRQFGIGYNRAGKLMDQLEAAGIVGPVNGSKPRNILVDMVLLESILSQN